LLLEQPPRRFANKLVIVNKHSTHNPHP
jgi:hypothetical protein